MQLTVYRYINKFFLNSCGSIYIIVIVHYKSEIVFASYMNNCKALLYSKTELLWHKQ